MGRDEGEAELEEGVCRRAALACEDEDTEVVVLVGADQVDLAKWLDGAQVLVVGVL